MKYRINTTWNNLQKDEGALTLVRQYLPAMEMLANQAPGQPLDSVRKHCPVAIQSKRARVRASSAFHYVLPLVVEQGKSARPLTAPPSRRNQKYYTL